MRVRRGSDFWPGGLGQMIGQFSPGDVVFPVDVGLDFTGVVTEVNPHINKVMVAWGGGSMKQHDPDEIQLYPVVSEAVQEKMSGVRVARRMRGDDGTVVPPHFQGDPETHGVDAPRGGGFSIMQDLVKDLRDESATKASTKTADVDGDDPLSKLEQYTADISKELLKYRKMYGLEGIRQNYKGTGKQKPRRQLWIRLPNGAVDVWLDMNGYSIGGVTQIKIPGTFRYDGRAPADVAKAIAEKLKSLVVPQETVTAAIKNALYWCAPGRTYRMTKGEQESGSMVCPRCGTRMESEPYLRKEKLLRCPECGFKVPTGKVVKQKIEIEVDSDGGVEVDVTTAAARRSR